MASILEEMKSEKEVKFRKLQVKVSEDLKEKLDFIAEHNGVPVVDYVAKLLEKSEITKVYNATKLAVKNAQKLQENSGNTSVNSVQNINTKEL